MTDGLKVSERLISIEFIEDVARRLTQIAGMIYCVSASAWEDDACQASLALDGVIRLVDTARDDLEKLIEGADGEVPA